MASSIQSITALQENVRSYVKRIKDRVRRRLFGANNERLDLLVDSFYKLTPEQRTATVAAAVAVITVLIFAFVIFYFHQISLLSNELNKRFDALHEVRSLKAEYQREDARFRRLVDTVSSAAASVRVKPLFEKIANEQAIQLEGLNETKIPIAAENPLSERLQEVRVELRLNNISIPKMLNFIVEVEKASAFLRLQDIQIRGRYGTKLFFDAQVKIHGYLPRD
jgi:hypothetical protein